MDLVI